uniref:Ubiquitin carboxyl-terminal hydrolase n=1 Tax=Oreochromis niloticus TaxID=8128 RepID=A0A669CUP4_ORENI
FYLSEMHGERIRFTSLDLGTTRWKEGTFEILEKDNKVNLCLRFNCGGASKTFQLNQNVKNISQNVNRIVLTLKDNSVITLDRMPQPLVQKTKEYLEKLKQGKSEKRKRLLTPDNDLNEDYPKENDSSRYNHILVAAYANFSQTLILSCASLTVAPLGSTPLQPSSFYGSRSVTKDYSQSHSFLDRPSSTAQTPTAKRSLMLPNHSTPFKKVRPSLDYGGWNKQRPSTLAQPQAPLQGFSNLGNTCYMNAILQSLFSLPSFSNDMLRQSIPWKKLPINALLRRFAHLMVKKDVACPETKKDLLRKVKSAISSTAERFSGNMQNDAHEFLSQCLDQLKDDVEKMNKSLTNEAAASSSSSVPGDEADTSRIYTCPVAVNMEFEVQHTITCKGCGEVVTKREQFNDLSIDLPRRKKTLPLRSIQDSLDLFFRMEEIEYSCEKCNGKSATVTHKFSKLPRVLILHLKRYSFNAQLSLNSKLGQQVLIPRYLTLLPHCTESTRPPISLGWSPQAALSRTLKTSQSVNSSTGPLRLMCFQRGAAIDSTDFSGINDDEMLAAVLEISRQEAGLSAPPSLDDEPTSSPDTGFGDTDAHDLAYHADLLEADSKQPADVLDSLDLTMDENKENQTPESGQQQGELDWVQQYNLDQEREEQELQQALAQSLQEHEAQEMREDDDLKRATELSLQEFNNSLPDLLCSDDDSGNEDVLDMEYTEAEAENLKRNAESGELANSFRLISVVSHIGSSSSSGHYISDVYDMKKQSWLTYNDLDVSRTQEAAVQRDRDRSGYIFFYMHK